MKSSKVRTAKAKGSSHEYDTLHNLQRTFPNMYLTSKQGFQQQYDLRDDINKVVVECKKHKSISWNQAKKWFKKLQSVAPEDYECMLVYKSNQQPVLVMTIENGTIFVIEFESSFGKFEKHPSTRVKRNIVFSIEKDINK